MKEVVEQLSLLVGFLGKCAEKSVDWMLGRNQAACNRPATVGDVYYSELAIWSEMQKAQADNPMILLESETLALPIMPKQNVGDLWCFRCLLLALVVNVLTD